MLAHLKTSRFEELMNKMSRETVASLLIRPEGRKTFMLAPAFLVQFLFISWEVWIIVNL